MAYGTEHVTHYLGYIDEKNIWPLALVTFE